MPGLQHQLSVRFRVDTFLSVGCDLTRDACPDLVMAGVTVRLGVRPSSSGDEASLYNQNVELVISTPGIRSVCQFIPYQQFFFSDHKNLLSESACLWSEHVIRSSKSSVPSLRSKLFQVW